MLRWLFGQSNACRADGLWMFWLGGLITTEHYTGTLILFFVGVIAISIGQVYVRSEP